jgi:hypothetical protein
VSLSSAVDAIGPHQLSFPFLCVSFAHSFVRSLNNKDNVFVGSLGSPGALKLTGGHKHVGVAFDFAEVAAKNKVGWRLASVSIRQRFWRHDFDRYETSRDNSQDFDSHRWLASTWNKTNNGSGPSKGVCGFEVPNRPSKSIPPTNGLQDFLSFLDFFRKQGVCPFLLFWV